MKKLILSAIALLTFSANSFSQNYNWITPNKTYLKMYVSDDGIYRINRTDFTNAGINTTGLDPRTVKVISKGAEIPIYFSGEQDGVFDANDYFDFYGTRNYGGQTTTYDQANNFAYSTNEYYNQYSDTNVYWVDWGGSNGVRFANPTFSTTTNYANSYFNDVLHFEKENYYTAGENFNSNDFRFLNTEKFRGEGWYWNVLYDNQSMKDTFSLPFLSPAPQTATFRIFAYPGTRNTSITNEHSLQLRVNGNLLTTLFANDINKIDTTVSFSSSLLTSGVNVDTIKYIPTGGSTGNINIDVFEITYPRLFKLSGEKLSANLGGADTTSKLFRISGYNSLNPVNVYDVVNNQKISNVTFNSDTLKFTGKSNAKFEIVNNNITKKPFRIKQKQVPNLVSSSNGADYLVIYHSMFQSQAEQLRAYRQSFNNYRSVKAEIEDIYDIFGYGIESPQAVRSFTKLVYDTWQLPKLKYICLFGRASLDPKKYLSSSAYYQNLIPTYGNPPSDGYFANFNIGTFCYYTQIGIGRLPAYYTAEAQTMVDKIIAYESQQSGSWYKDFVFITGGGTPAEQGSHQLKSNIEIESYVTPPPLSANAVKIYRTDVSGSTTFNIKDSVRNSISRGCMFVNYRGHAGSHDWEVALNDPNTLTNGSKLPIILSLTCFTGENSKSDYRGFGERMVYFADKGAIGFVGTTGWSYAQYGNDYGTYMLSKIRDSVRIAGELTKYAQTQMARDSISFSIRHTVNCYSYIGDPAVTLKLPRIPDFAISNSDYKLSNQFPHIGDNLNITLYPKNFGLNADSCKIRIDLKKDNVTHSFKDTVLYNFGYADSVNNIFKLDTIGNYVATVTLDYDNWHPQEYKGNNVLTIHIPVKDIAYIPLKPVNNSLVNSDSVEFVGLNPRFKSSKNTIRVIVQFDTTSLFNSPLNRTFVNKNISGVVTKFKTNVPAAVNNRVYYWKTNCIINEDSSGWSDVQKFVYNNSLTSSANNSKQITESSNPSGNVSIYKISGNQYSSEDYKNTVYKTNGVELADYSSYLYVRSLGSNAEEASYFTVGNQSIFIDAGLNTGINMLKVRKLNGSIVQTKNIKMTAASSNDSLVTFLNTFDSTYYLMLLNAAYVPGGVNLNATAKTKLRQFGSIYCDSIGLLGYFHTWSLIGYLGATHAQTSEAFDPCCRPAPGCVSCNHWTESISTMNVTFKKTSGTVSNIIGPAQTWSDFSWTQTIPLNSSIKFDVYGIDQNDQQTLLLSNLQTNTFNDLSSINAYQYPRLNIVSKFSIDTVSGKSSPVLNLVRANYYAPAELTWDINSLGVYSKYKAGDELKFAVNYHNPGFINLPGLISNVYKMSVSNSNLILTDTVSGTLNVDSSIAYSVKFVLPYFRDSMNIIFDLKPKGSNNEIYTYNNDGIISFKLNRNSPTSTIKIFSDGQLLNNGDFVKSKPEIKVEVTNSGEKTMLSDTTKVALKLNDNYVPYYVNGTMNPLLKVLSTDKGGSRGDNSLYFYPQLKSGTNKLAIAFHTDDLNSGDTVSYDVIVSEELLVKDFYNYPNPMKDNTNFIFNLGGAYAPEKFKIRIYTVSGKIIKELNSPVIIGLNQIPWDGRDNDGDIIANGTYFYKLIAEDELKTETQTQKLVILR